MIRFAPLLLVGCVSLEPGFEEGLTQRGGCADVMFYAVDEADQTMLTVWVEGLVAEATAAGQTRTTVFDLPDADVDVYVEAGHRVSDATCDDVIENGGPVVQGTWNATGGTATIEIVPGETAWDATGTLLLEDITFEDGAGFDSFGIDEVAVGWLAG